MNKKTILILFLSLLCSALLMLLWGLGFMHLDYANQYTGFLVMILTFYTPRLIPKLDNHRNLQLILLFSGTIFFEMVGFDAQGWRMLGLPSFWAFLLYAVAVFLPKTKSFVPHIAVFAYAFFGFWVVYSYTEYGQERLRLAIIEEEPTITINEKSNLSEFSFLLSPRDTGKIRLEKPVLIETWNETCTPCMASIRDLQDEFERDTSFHYIYLYQYRGTDRKLSTSQIFDFEAIKDKSKIRIDLENRLFEKMELGSYPFFLVFDRQGKLAGYQVGYISEKKSEVVEKLRKLIEQVK